MTIREKKRQKALITSLVIILIILLSIFIYFLIKKFNVSEKFEIRKKHITYEVIEKGELEKIVTEELDILDGKDKINEINNQEKLLYSVNLYINGLDKTMKDSSENIEIEVEELENIFSKSSIGYLGLQFEDITDTGGNVLVKYDKENKKYYVLNNYYNYKNSIKKIYTKATNFYEDNKKYTIEYNYLFGVLEGISYQIYTDYDDAINKTNSFGNIENNDSLEDNIYKFYNDNYKEIRDNLVIVSYTFEKVDNKINLIEYKK